MSGSIFGKNFAVSTWGESHGKAIGVVVDGCPAGIHIDAEYIQKDLDRRKPGISAMTTSRSEQDKVEILSGIFNGITTGTPISLIIYNNDMHSCDYSHIKDIYRPSHADLVYDQKYGFRDYRGGGRSSGRETAARVAAGAIAKKILYDLGMSITAYTMAIGNIQIDRDAFDKNEVYKNPLGMPDRSAAHEAFKLVSELKKKKDSTGGIIECIVEGFPSGVGEPVFDKLDANLAKAVFSIGAVKGIEFGTGFSASSMTGSQNNDEYSINESNQIFKLTNNSGGIVGGISDGSEIIFRVAFKPTPSIGVRQKTINTAGEKVNIEINGRHDPVIVPRAVVVVEAMTAITLLDYLFQSILSSMDNIKKALGIYKI